MISIEEFSKFRLKNIFIDIETVKGFEYYDQIWSAEIDGFTQCLFTGSKNPITKVVCLDVLDLSSEKLNQILTILELDIIQIVTDANVLKVESKTEMGFSIDIIIENIFHLNLNYNKAKVLNYISIHSFIPKDVLDKFKPKPDPKIVENELNKLILEKGNYSGILTYDLFSKLKLEYFLDYDFIANYPRENQLFYSFGDKEYYKKKNWIGDAIGLSRFLYLPKDLKTLRLLCVHFANFEPSKLNLLMNLVGLDLSQGLKLTEINSILNSEPLRSQNYGENHIFYDYQVYSNKNEEYFLECYYSINDGLVSFDLTNFLKLKNYEWN